VSTAAWTSDSTIHTAIIRLSQVGQNGDHLPLLPSAPWRPSQGELVMDDASMAEKVMLKRRRYERVLRISTRFNLRRCHSTVRYGANPRAVMVMFPFLPQNMSTHSTP